MDKTPSNSQDVEVRKGPWTLEEDLILTSHIANHGEGVWNSLAKAAGLKRTGKSCRLRWLNYLRPDLRRGNITPEEQLLIMELHAKWGNSQTMVESIAFIFVDIGRRRRDSVPDLSAVLIIKESTVLKVPIGTDCRSLSENDEKDTDSNVAGWSKIAKHLPGRTDNEIKNYWRTRIQKHIKQAETFAAQVSSETNEHGSSSSQVSGTTELMVSNCLPPYQGDVDAFSGANIPQELNENYWSMEDLWSMQLLNGD
ncbi:hypothetical protein POTOM_053737 [Populus tomentosa]|uniref:Uncharacterized protein n=1 Tax=Populus tomentosa TaxID=118781 RepID=A0A8X7Y4M6_POPTO|nr:hypothetical protein POTOM_053737 [Populus tomentosa]